MKAPLQTPLQEQQSRLFDATQKAFARQVTGESGFADNRPAALAQRKMTALIDNSPRVLQQQAFAQRVNNTPMQVAEAPDKKSNNTGLPDQLKSGIEAMSGMSMDHVKVHYNSSQPAQLNAHAHAYAQGSDIHVGSGQEKYLPHEAWHVLQQAQGRVRPTTQMKGGIPVNDDHGLEHEADIMGVNATQLWAQLDTASSASAQVLQRKCAAQLSNRRVGGEGTVNLADNRPDTMRSISSTTIQAKSYVESSGQTFTWGNNKTIVGKKILAKLDPADPLKGESANINTDQTKMMTALRTYYVINGGDLVKGHLLNDNLGGKAMNNNLFPITRAANKLHLQTTENYAKTQLWTHKNPIWYSVEVGGSANANQHTHSFDVKVGNWHMRNDTMDPAAVQGSVTSSMGDPRDYNGANGGDMDTYSATTLSAAMAKKLALHPHTSVSGMSKHESDYRDATGEITNTGHGSGGYISHS